MTVAQQMALPFAHAPHYAAADFFRTPSNEAALAWLARAEEWPDGRLIVWGEAGSGKTHLLHVWAAEVGGVVADGIGLDWKSALATGSGPIGVDHADRAPEDALLHLINAAAELRRRLLLIGRAAPVGWGSRLPDLASRLRAAAAVELRAPSDDMLSPLFARLLAERQIAVPAAVQEWLLRRLPRSPAALSDAARRLDHAMLAQGGRVTRAMALSIVESAT